MPKTIFISHAAKDKNLADAFVDLLQTGANIASDDIFCSSLEGLGIPSGVSFVDHIKAEIQNPKAVVALISQNYLASQFCLCELGAAWAMSHTMLPLLVTPLKYLDVQGVLVATHMIPIDHSDRLSEFIDLLIAAVGGKPVNSARWGVKKKMFLDALPNILKGLPNPTQVAPADHQRAIKERDEALEALTETEGECSNLRKLVAELTIAKDATEVRNIKRKHSKSADTLDALLKSAASALKEHTPAVAFVAFRSYGHGQSAEIDSRRDPNLSDDAEAAVDRQYLTVDEQGYSLNRGHPKIRKLITTLDELSIYLSSSEISNDDVTAFEDKYEMPMDMANRDYWNLFLDPRLRRVQV